MKLAYLQIFADKMKTLNRISDESFCVLMRAMLAYALEDKEIDQLNDPVADCLWPTFQEMIDQSARALESKRRAGQSGGNQKASNAKREAVTDEAEHSTSVADCSRGVADVSTDVAERSKTPKNQESRYKNQDTRYTRSNERERDTRARKAAPDVLSSLAPEVQSAFRDFVAARVKMRKPMTDRAIALAVGKLLEVAGNDPAAQVAAINRTVEHGWQTFYPDDRPAQTARSGTLQPVKRVNAQQYSQREYTNEQLEGLFEELG